MDAVFDPDILGYYDEANEQFRLGRHRLEAIRTQELLLRFLPPAPASVLDVGGGPGYYASWLADEGYQVHLVDPVPLHVEQAAHGADGRFTAAVGDARRLAEADGSVDVVLLLGPLYHLLDRAERVQAWREAARVVRPGGVVVGALISRTAPLFDGLSRGVLADQTFATTAFRAYGTGILEPHDRSGFTRAYFHTSDEVAPEVVDGGLELQCLLGVEGPGEWLADIEARLDDPAQREAVLSVARALEQDPAAIAVSAHQLAVARRPAA